MNKVAVGILSAITGASVGAASVGKVVGSKVDCWQQMSEKHLALFKMMNQWVKVKQEGKNLSFYLETRGYKKIAIYGLSYAGETLIDELKDSDVQIIYGIDKNADTIYVEIDTITPDEFLEDVDAIVVTAITFFDEIEEMLSEKIKCPIISLEDMLYEI